MIAMKEEVSRIILSLHYGLSLFQKDKKCRLIDMYSKGRQMYTHIHKQIHTSDL